MATHRHADLMRQGFMKPAKLKANKTPPISDEEWARQLAEAARKRWEEQGFDQ